MDRSKPNSDVKKTPARISTTIAEIRGVRLLNGQKLPGDHGLEVGLQQMDQQWSVKDSGRVRQPASLMRIYRPNNGQEVASDGVGGAQELWR